MESKEKELYLKMLRVEEDLDSMNAISFSGIPLSINFFLMSS